MNFAKELNSKKHQTLQLTVSASFLKHEQISVERFKKIPLSILTSLLKLCVTVISLRLYFITVPQMYKVNSVEDECEYIEYVKC